MKLIGLAALTAFGLSFYSLNKKQPQHFLEFVVYFGLSLVSYATCVKMIPIVKIYNIKAELFGYDINKRGTPAGEIKM